MTFSVLPPGGGHQLVELHLDGLQIKFKQTENNIMLKLIPGIRVVRKLYSVFSKLCLL